MSPTAKSSGLAWTTLSVDLNDGSTATDIRNDLTNLSFSTPRAVQDITGIDKSAMERLLLLSDFQITLNGVFNAALSHTVFASVSLAAAIARTTSIGIGGKTLANECLYTDYSLTRGNDGAFTFTAPGVLAGGVVPTWA